MSLLVCLNFTSTIDKMVIPLKYQQNRFMQPHSDSAVLYIDFGMLGLCRNMPKK